MEEETKLPAHAKEMKDGGYVCAHCGGAIGSDGYSEAMMEDESEEQAESEGPPEAKDESLDANAEFARALRRRH